ncbi:MAG: tetraacyldisaccharide 4'-kinase [Alphaproteobacteria bacterium]|nr:tetraacyldisaccharide 4'-kinase [Alphaproteobacteria bacterium]MDE2337628.1 tetraacyldisaccharide 4'-kinase [Alphaproteobacteria bacterium]
MAAPPFWYRQKTPAEQLLRLALTPVGWAYGATVRRKFDMYFPVPMEKPVICVGNLVAGGAGKTPVAVALADMLKEKGFNPHLLSRGYGGKEAGPLQVAPSRDTAYDVGDEALLLVEHAPTWVAVKRALGAQMAMESGADIVVMDDGFQNAVIYKDFSLVVIDGKVGFGNRAVFPAGPLREPLLFGLARADAFVIIGTDATGAAEFIKRHSPAPVLFAALEPDADNPDVRGKDIFAFAGIGRPAKFRETLEAAGANIAGWQSFPDHYPYDDDDLQDFLSQAALKGAPVITTAKDHVRVPASIRGKVAKFGVHLAWQDKDAVLPLIEQALAKRHA